MEEIKVQVTEKVVEQLEQKSEEVEKKVEETVDKVLDSVEETTQKVADEVVTSAVKPVADLIDKIDDDPRVKAVLDNITSGIVEQVDGRMFSCFCLGFDFSLRISRRTPAPPQTKSAETQNTETKEQPQNTQTAE
jgi:vacuolar-type H+-ATPase subunit H